MQKKVYVEVTGVDGCGKTTQAKYITEQLNKKGINAVYFKSPLFDWVRDAIASVGRDEHGADPVTDSAIFTTCHRLEQYLLRGIFTGELPERMMKDPGAQRVLAKAKLPAEVIICQRGIVDFYSFRMGDGFDRATIDALLQPEKIWKGHKYRPGEFIGPDAILHLDCDPEIAMTRIPKEDKWETVPFLIKLRAAYHELFAQQNGNRPLVLKDARIFEVSEIINNGTPARPTIAEVKQEVDRTFIPYLENLMRGTPSYEPR